MSEEIYKDDGQFADEYKFKLIIHPIVQKIFSQIFQSKKSKKEHTPRELHDIFFEALDESSKKFHALGVKAFDEAETVQNGLNLANDVLYQYFPVMDNMQPRFENYRKVNKFFWGKFFYLNGFDEANKNEDNSTASPWEHARLYATKYWKYGQDDFPETISWGYLYLLENDDSIKINFANVPEFLNGFEYSKEVVLGFSYILGVVAMTQRGNEKPMDIIMRSTHYPYVDINYEYEELLGPLRDGIINKVFDELIWRSKASIDVREIKIEGMQSAVYVYQIENHQLIEESDRQVQNLYNAENIFTQAMEKIGREVDRVGHSFEDAYRAGICAANLRAQSDIKASGQVAKACRSSMPLIMKACISSIDHDMPWDGYLKIQIPLRVFIDHLPDAMAEMIWSYQSFVLFSKQTVKAGIEELDTDSFMKECREMAFVFFDANHENCKYIALQKQHWRTFPHISKEFDEKPLILETIKNTMGYSIDSKGLANQSTLKALIIFGYFCAICETILLGRDDTKIH